LFHPFGFGFEQVLFELAILHRKRTRLLRKCDISPTNIAHGFWRRKEKQPSDAGWDSTVAAIQRRDKIA
jgi:hypothetical protein